jgi:hypothetical protein
MSENNFNTGLNVKSVLIKLNLFDLAKKYLTYYNLFNHLSLEYKNRNKAVKDSIKNIFHFHVPSLSQSKGLQYKELFSKVDISISDEGFIFFLDKYKSLGNFNFTLNNLSVDYLRYLTILLIN